MDTHRVGGISLAHTLNFDYEVRSADEAFSDLPATEAHEEMLDLALHIIRTGATHRSKKSLAARLNEIAEAHPEAKRFEILEPGRRQGRPEGPQKWHFALSRSPVGETGPEERGPAATN